MKKIILSLALVFVFIATSCVSTSNTNKNTEVDDSNCLRGKYNTYKTDLFENEKFLEIVKKYPLVVDSKYDFISKLPAFYTFEWFQKTSSTVQVIYINYDENGNSNSECRDYYTISLDWLGTPYEIVEMKDFKKMLEEIQSELVFVDSDVKNVMDSKGLSLDKALLEVQQTRKDTRIKEIKNNYTFNNLIDWMCGEFVSTLPEPKTLIYVGTGLFVSEKVIYSENVGYFVYCAYGRKKIFICGKNLNTEITPEVNWGTGYKNGLGLQGGFQMEYTGKTVVELSDGTTINAPIFIAK